MFNSQRATQLEAGLGQIVYEPSHHWGLKGGDSRVLLPQIIDHREIDRALKSCILLQALNLGTPNEGRRTRLPA